MSVCLSVCVCVLTKNKYKLRTFLQSRYLHIGQNVSRVEMSAESKCRPSQNVGRVEMSARVDMSADRVEMSRQLKYLLR